MKKVLFYLLSAVIVGCLASMAVSCGKEDIRDQMNPLDVEGPEGTPGQGEERVLKGPVNLRSAKAGRKSTSGCTAVRYSLLFACALKWQ